MAGYYNSRAYSRINLETLGRCVDEIRRNDVRRREKTLKWYAEEMVTNGEEDGEEFKKKIKRPKILWKILGKLLCGVRAHGTS